MTETTITNNNNLASSLLFFTFSWSQAITARALVLVLLVTYGDRLASINLFGFGLDDKLLGFAYSQLASCVFVTVFPLQLVYIFLLFVIFIVSEILQAYGIVLCSCYFGYFGFSQHVPSKAIRNKNKARYSSTRPLFALNSTCPLFALNSTLSEQTGSASAL